MKKNKKTYEIENLYRFFYVNLYKESGDTFEYNKFVEVALGKKIEDFQARLARFEINKLERSQREAIVRIKDSQYHGVNYDFASLLEWIDYNYEAYLNLKQKEDIDNKRRGFKESDKKYK